MAEPHSPDTRDGFLRLVVASAVVGGMTGLLVSLFRETLVRADLVRSALSAWRPEGFPIGGVLLVLGAGVAVGFAAWGVQRLSPHASGSGIPQVEAELEGTLPPPSLMLIPVKFVGGVLAIGSGLLLGREGPSVQMGACIGGWLGRSLGLDPAAVRTLLSSGAAAGLATAFDAPISGAVFILEELVRRFDLRTTASTLTTSVTAVAVSHALHRPSLIFEVPSNPDVSLPQLGLALGVGLVCGMVGWGYNRLLLGWLTLVGGLRRIPIWGTAGAIGMGVAALGCVVPDAVGGGESLARGLILSPASLVTVAGLAGLRFLLGGLSYAARTPGGLFAPILALGALTGGIVGTVGQQILPSLEVTPTTLSFLGMAALFAAIVRSPATGIILVSEMAGTTAYVLPLMAACIGAECVAVGLGSEPVYDSLRRRLTGQKPPGPCP
ncbi:MAG: ClC family H(+)/Cl(-) exchange transporter [Verrucomicrobiota bacterium]